MRVLWFSNTPSLGASYINLKSIGGGWIESLETELTKISNLELGIVFKCNHLKTSQFNIGATNYFPISTAISSNKVRKFYERWMHKIENEENIQKYLNIVNQFKPDIIHIFGTESDFGLIISKTKVPCIIHIQGNLTVINHKWFNGISEFDLLRFSRKLLFLRGYGFVHNYFVCKKAAKRERNIFNACKNFMGRTDWDKRITLALSEGSNYYHCDEILRKQFYIDKWHEKSSNDFTILTTIRNNIYKGLETIYECNIILKHHSLEFKITWKIAGVNAEDEISHLIEQKFKGKEFNDNIKLLGSIQEGELINEMLKTNLFVHPSHIDNSPNSICEAMMLGMPIIATYAGGIPSLIADKKEGLLVQNGDPYALAGAIIELIKNREYAYLLGSNARIKALERHNPDKIVNNLLNIYSSITHISD